MVERDGWTNRWSPTHIVNTDTRATRAGLWLRMFREPKVVLLMEICMVCAEKGVAERKVLEVPECCISEERKRTRSKL